MANVRKEPQKVVPGGLSGATYHGSLSTSDTYLVRNDGRVILHFKKTGAGNCVVTLETPGTVDGLAVSDRTVTVPATTGDVFMGPFSPRVYNDVSGDLKITLSEVTGLSFAVLRVG